MSAHVNRCLKCNGEMVQGFIFGREGPNRIVSTWVEGAPEKVGWLFQQVEAPPDKCVPVGVFRCSACGSGANWKWFIDKRVRIPSG